LQKTHTANISEGGLFLSSYQGPLLPLGEIVTVSLAGVLSDDPDVSSYRMRVVHRAGQGLGLAFT
jgi:hypothetical protein